MEKLDYTHGEVSVKTTHYFIAGIALVTAMSWNGAIKDVINEYFPMPRENVIANFIYAFCMTLFLILLIYVLPDTSTELPENVKHHVKLAKIEDLHAKISDIERKMLP